MTTEGNPEDEPQPEQQSTEPPVDSTAEMIEAEEETAEARETDDQSTGAKPEDQLQAVIEAAKASRLSPADEDHALQLLKQAIPGGPKALPAILDAILALPWGVGVRAVTEAWPETKPAGRARLIGGMAKIDSEASRRIRLSLARGLHAQDAASALKLVVSVCEAMGGAQGGSTTKDRQVFANVMLGKARPWIMNISMTDMKPAEAHKLITPALESCGQSPIFTQIWVLRWICDGDKFGVIPPEHVEAIGKSINRWQPRWRKELRKIIPRLPDALEAQLVDSPSHQPAPAVHHAPEIPASEAAEEPDAPIADTESDEAPSAPEEERVSQQRPPPPQRQADPRDRSSRNRPAAATGLFDLNRSLREIESYVVRLRSELQQAQAVARRREPAPDRHRGRMAGPAASPEELDELRRHNLQLTEQNEELLRRIEELTNDHEDRAATLEINDALEQFKTFLGLKLKEDFADYNAISRESLNEVIRRHAHEILGRIFSVLQAEGVRFDREG